jgi:hypothetical protein
VYFFFNLGVPKGPKTGCKTIFWLFWTSNRLKKVHKGLQVGGMYDPKFKLNNKPLTKSLGPLF